MSGEARPVSDSGAHPEAGAISRPQSLELVKWVAFALMVLDHVNLYLIDGAFPVGYLLGRLVFPLFAFCLAFGVAGHGAMTLDGVVRRLLLWAVFSQIPWAIFHHGSALNVMFQLWAGAALYQLAFSRNVGALRMGLALLAVPVSFLAEFPLAGVFVVFGAMWWAESRRWPGASLCAVGLLLLYGINGTWFALLAPAVFWGLSRGPDIPRVRHAFYALYPLHFVGLALARHFI